MKKTRERHVLTIIIEVGWRVKTGWQISWDKDFFFFFYFIRRNTSHSLSNMTACLWLCLHQQPDQPQLAHGTSYIMNPAISPLLPFSDCKVLGLQWIIDAKNYDTEATGRRNPRGISNGRWPQEQPGNQTPPQHLWKRYPIDQWVCECLQGIRCNSFRELGSSHL